MKKLLLYMLTILLVNSQLFSQCDNPPPPPTEQPIPNQNYYNLSAFTTAAVNKGYTISATETFDNLNGFYANGLSGNFGTGSPTWTASAPGQLYTGPAGGSSTLSTNNAEAPLTLNFNPGVTALGANIFVTDASFGIIPGTITVTFSNGSTTSFSTSSASDFFGTTSNSALITSISISVIAFPVGTAFVTLDNLVIATGTLNPSSIVNHSDSSNFSSAIGTAGLTISATETFVNVPEGFTETLTGNFGTGTPTWTASATGGLYTGTAGGSMTLSTNNPVPLSLTFNPGVTALGSNIFITESSFGIIPGTITVAFSNGETTSFSTSSASDFFGAIAYSTLITSISISATNTVDGYVTLDNLVIATGTINTTLACYQSYIYNSTSCSWELTGTQPLQPTLACYEEAIFNDSLCEWSVIGEMPEEPTDLACYEEAVFNDSLCEWSVIGEDTTPEPAVVTLSGGALTATGGGTGMGLWVDCATQQPIAGAMGTTFTPTANGIYTYVILNATMTCFGIGNCVEVTNVSLDENDEVLFSIAPNPSNGIFTLKNPSLIDGVIVITDGSGRIIYESSLDTSEKSIDISNASLGIYYLNLKSDNNKVIRLIKN